MHGCARSYSEYVRSVFKFAIPDLLISSHRVLLLDATRMRQQYHRKPICDRDRQPDFQQRVLCLCIAGHEKGSFTTVLDGIEMRQRDLRKLIRLRERELSYKEQDCQQLKQNRCVSYIATYASLSSVESQKLALSRYVVLSYTMPFLFQCKAPATDTV